MYHVYFFAFGHRVQGSVAQNIKFFLKRIANSLLLSSSDHFVSLVNAGQITMHDLELNPEALEDFDFPFKIISGLKKSRAFD